MGAKPIHTVRPVENALCIVWMHHMSITKPLRQEIDVGHFGDRKDSGIEPVAGRLDRKM